MVRCEHIECIAEQFIRTSPEMIERPAPFQNLGKLGDGDEVRRLEFERIEPHRDDRISRLDEDEFVAQMAT